jgi:hypothetical protein
MSFIHGCFCRDWKTGDSLNYGFIGFDTEEACEQVCALLELGSVTAVKRVAQLGI